MAQTADDRLSGRFALVVGGASGIGQAAAFTLASAGASIAIADINLEEAEATASAVRSHGGGAGAYRLDVTLEDDWTALATTLLGSWPQLDVVVNCAGVASQGSIGDMPLQEWQRVLAINLTGVFLGTRFAIRAMKSRGTGSIINIASVAGIKALPEAGAYCVSKSGACMLSRQAALECARSGWQIRVNAILPGGVKTPIWRKLGFWDERVAQLGSEDAVWKSLADGVPAKRFAEPNEIAQAILYLASDDSAYVTGTELVIDGGLTA